MDREEWPSSKKTVAKIFASKTQEEWCRVFDGTDACVTPVLSGDEAPDHRHNKISNTFLESADGGMEPSPAPRLSRTPATVRTTAQTNVGQDTTTVLLESGFSQEEIEGLRKNGIVEEQKSKLWQNNLGNLN